VKSADVSTPVELGVRKLIQSAPSESWSADFRSFTTCPRLGLFRFPISISKFPSLEGAAQTAGDMVNSPWALRPRPIARNARKKISDLCRHGTLRRL